ncbi:MAG: hypothetical protein ACREQJ_03215 [Candidatus Binatia bacterium]
MNRAERASACFQSGRFSMRAHPFVIRERDGRWIFGREGAPFVSFQSKEAALEGARRFMEVNHPEEELIVVEEDQHPLEKRLRALH